MIAVQLNVLFSDVFILLAVENRVRPLVLVVKKWASFHELNDASRGTLSSYTLVLMVLHYLQSKYFFYVLKLSLLSSDLCSSNKIKHQQESSSTQKNLKIKWVYSVSLAP